MFLDRIPGAIQILDNRVEKSQVSILAAQISRGIVLANHFISLLLAAEIWLVRPGKA